MTPATRDLVQLLERPDHVPIWWAGLITLTLVLAGDMLTPASTPLSAGLPALLLGSLIACSERLTARLTTLAVLGSVAAGIYEIVRSNYEPDTILLRLAVTVIVLLSGFWATWQARQGMAAPDPLLYVPGPAGDGEAAHPVERAAQTLAHLAGAPGHRLHRVENAAEWISRQALAPRVTPRSTPGLRLPKFRLPVPVPTQAKDVRYSLQGNVYVRFMQPGQGETVVELTRPSAPIAFITDAAQILQMQIERLTLFEQVHVQRELLRDLVYAFSHDLRTPITANILHSEAALSGAYGPLSPKLGQFLTQSQRANRDLLTVSDQLMLLAEYESGDLTEEAGTTVDLEAVVRSVVGDVQLRGRERGIHFELNLHPCQVIGHAYDLRRAVQNLLENAVKFSPEHVFVRVNLRTNAQHALIEVMDQGSGVPEAQMPHLFKRFRTSTRGSGTGFGLYLARRIAERYGGTISYERSASDHPWTVFRLYLPLTQ